MGPPAKKPKQARMYACAYCGIRVAPDQRAIAHVNGVPILGLKPLARCCRTCFETSLLRFGTIRGYFRPQCNACRVLNYNATTNIAYIKQKQHDMVGSQKHRKHDVPGTERGAAAKALRALESAEAIYKRLDVDQFTYRPSFEDPLAHEDVICHFPFVLACGHANSASPDRNDSKDVRGYYVAGGVTWVPAFLNTRFPMQRPELAIHLPRRQIPLTLDAARQFIQTLLRAHRYGGKLYKCADAICDREDKSAHLKTLRPMIPTVAAYLAYRIILQGGRCEFTKIPFNFAETCSRPSPERISNAIGYYGSNMEVVCAAFNVAPFMLGDSPRFPTEYFYTARRAQIDAAVAADTALLLRLMETEYAAEWRAVWEMAHRFPV